MYSFRCFAHASAMDCCPRAPNVPNIKAPWLFFCTSYAQMTSFVLALISMMLASRPRVELADDPYAALPPARFQFALPPEPKTNPCHSVFVETTKYWAEVLSRVSWMGTLFSRTAAATYVSNPPMGAMTTRAPAGILPEPTEVPSSVGGDESTDEAGDGAAEDRVTMAAIILSLAPADLRAIKPSGEMS